MGSALPTTTAGHPRTGAGAAGAPQVLTARASLRACYQGLAGARPSLIAVPGLMGPGLRQAQNQTPPPGAALVARPRPVRGRIRALSPRPVRGRIRADGPQRVR